MVEGCRGHHACGVTAGDGALRGQVKGVESLDETGVAGRKNNRSGEQACKKTHGTRQLNVSPKASVRPGLEPAPKYGDTFDVSRFGAVA